MLTICRREKNGNEFLEYYTCTTEEKAKESVKELNTKHPSTLWNGVKIDWNTTKEFFIHEQEPIY